MRHAAPLRRGPGIAEQPGMGDDRPAGTGGGAQSREGDRLAGGGTLRRHVDHGGRIPAGDGDLARGCGTAPTLVGHRERHRVDARARVAVRQHPAATGRPVAERPVVGHHRSRRSGAAGIEDDRSAGDREGRGHVEGRLRRGSRLHPNGARLRGRAPERVRDRQPDGIGARGDEDVRHGLSAGVRAVAEAPREAGHEAAGIVDARRGTVPALLRGVTVGRAEQRRLAGRGRARREREARRHPERGDDAPGRHQPDHHGPPQGVRMVLRPRRHPNGHRGAGIGLAGRIRRQPRRRVREAGAAVRACHGGARGERAEVLPLARRHDLERQREPRHGPRALVAREHRHGRAGRPVEGQDVGNGGELQRQRELGRADERPRQRTLLHARGGDAGAGQNAGPRAEPRPPPRRPHAGLAPPSRGTAPDAPAPDPRRLSPPSRQSALRCGRSP